MPSRLPSASIAATLLVSAGLPATFDGEGLLPHPALADWIARRVREAEKSLGVVW